MQVRIQYHVLKMRSGFIGNVHTFPATLIFYFSPIFVTKIIREVDLHGRYRYVFTADPVPGSALASASMRTPMRIRIQEVKYRRERFAYMNKLDFLFAFSDIS